MPGSRHPHAPKPNSSVLASKRCIGPSPKRYSFAQGAASKRTLKGAAALIAILVVGGTSYLLYPLAMMLLLLLRWVFAGSAPTR